MSAQKKPLPPKLQEWVEARRRFRLSHAHVQMARELGLNPKKLGKIANHRRDPWKAPLPQFIEHIYAKRFGRDRPEVVLPLEERARQTAMAKAARKAARAEQAVSSGERTAETALRGSGHLDRIHVTEDVAIKPVLRRFP